DDAGASRVRAGQDRGDRVLVVAGVVTAAAVEHDDVVALGSQGGLGEAQLVDRPALVPQDVGQPAVVVGDDRQIEACQDHVDRGRGTGGDRDGLRRGGVAGQVDDH